MWRPLNLVQGNGFVPAEQPIWVVFGGIERIEIVKGVEPAPPLCKPPGERGLPGLSCPRDDDDRHHTQMRAKTGQSNGDSISSCSMTPLNHLITSGWYGMPSARRSISASCSGIPG